MIKHISRKFIGPRGETIDAVFVIVFQLFMILIIVTCCPQSWSQIVLIAVSKSLI